jgi:hypothetical protein
MAVNIGFVGYSDSKFDKKYAQKLIDAVFDKIENEFCNTSELVNIITGATNLGIPKMVYDKANEENIRLGKRFNLVGVMAKEGYEYELYPCDIIYAYGKNFGDESKEFISMLDLFIKIGGGKQSIKELSMAKEKGIPTIEYSL